MDIAPTAKYDDCTYMWSTGLCSTQTIFAAVETNATPSWANLPSIPQRVAQSHDHLYGARF